ncbi:MAG: phosphodiester glycosidase family protein [Persicimonas sp.]
MAVFLLISLVGLSSPPEATAGDSWSTPHPGMRRLSRTTSEPNRINALEIDLCANGVGVRATKSDERQQTPSSFAQSVGAQAAVNGDFFGYSTYSTSGLAIGEGEHWSGTTDGAANAYAAFSRDRVEFSGDNETRGPEDWMQSVVSGLGTLVEDGQAITSPPSQPSHCSQRHPRTAMGLSRDRRTLYLAVVDGRSTSSRGMTCVELANLMEGLGAWSAVNFDGGGSTAMWIEGVGVANQPSDGTQRTVANHLAVYANGSGEPGACDRSYDEAAFQVGARGQSTTTDIDGDGLADACSLGPDGLECYTSEDGTFATRVQGPAWLQDDGWSDPANYSTIRFGDLDGDGRADVCVRYNDGVRCYLSEGDGFGSHFDGPELSDDTGWGSSASYYSSLAMADVDGDGRDDLCARAAAGFHCYFSNSEPGNAGGFSGRSATLEALSNAEGFNEFEYYGTIRLGDVNGDGRADVCARTADGMRCWLSDGHDFSTEISGPNWSDAGGWNKLPYWPTVRLADVDGDGLADLCARGASGFRCHLSEGDGFSGAFGGDLWPNDWGWDDYDNTSTIRLADIDGDGDLDACARSNDRLVCNPWVANEDGGGPNNAFGPTIDGPEWSNDGDWDHIMYHATIRTADIDGDGTADLCARGYSRFDCATSPLDGSDTDLQGPEWSVPNGWNSPAFYTTIQLVDPPPTTPDEPGEDAGHSDAGQPDAGQPDTGQAPDTGSPDTGSPDATDHDTGQIGADADQPSDPSRDNASTQATTSGCACSQSGPAQPAGGVLLWLVGVALLRRRW